MPFTFEERIERMEQWIGYLKMTSEQSGAPVAKRARGNLLENLRLEVVLAQQEAE